MYTTEADPTDDRPIVFAFLVWVCGDDLESALTELGEEGKRRAATAIVGLRIEPADGSYYVPAETFVGGGTTQRDMGSRGYNVKSKSWTVYGTAIRRKGDPLPRLFPPGVGAMSGWDFLKRAREVGVEWPALKAPE